MNDERYACTSLKGTVLTASQATGRRVVANKFLGLVNVTIVKHRAVVTGENNQGILYLIANSTTTDANGVSYMVSCACVIR